MAEIRCPMCGKPNPENLEVCQFCQARLKPLVASNASNDSIIPEQSDSDLPDWFESDAISDFGDEDDDTPFEDDGETDDWMTRLGDDSELEKQSQPQEESETDKERQAASRMDFNNNGIPDWLEDMEADRAAPSLGASEETSDTELPSWLSRDDEEVEPSETFEQSSDLPDWLSGLGAQEDDVLEGDGATQDKEASPIPPFAADDVDLPDWLTAGSDEETSVPSGKEGGLPDWLSDGGEDEIPHLDETIPLQNLQPEITEGDDDLPEWLVSDGESEPPGDSPDDTSSYIGQETIPIKDDFAADEALPPSDTEDVDLPALISTSDEDDFPEWLSDMGAVEAASQDDETPISDAEETDLPDWLADLSAQEEAQTEGAPKAQKPFDIDTGDLPSWLADDSDDVKSPPAVESEFPEQLADPEPQAPSVADIAPQPETLPEIGETEGDSLPDWLSGEEELPSAVALTTDGELPDWLSEDIADDAEAESVDASTDPVDDLPDWLAGFGEQDEDSEQVADQLPTADSPLAADGELPEWLSEDSAYEIDGIVSTAAEESDFPEELADEKVDDIAGGIALAAGLAKAVGDSSDMPDWLADEESEIESVAPSAAESDVPDWLSDIEGVEAPLSEEVISTVADPDEIPDWLADVVGEEVETSPAIEEDLPDWLSEIDGVEEISEVEPDLPLTSVDESRAVPDWLHDSEVPLSVPEGDAEIEPVPAAPFAADEEFDDDLFEMDQLSDWISDDVQTDLDQVAEKTGPVDDLEPAELPGWLAAMRPVESSVSDPGSVAKRGAMENSGPLAGLYGVLAAEPDIARLKKPPVYSSKLNITDAQQTHASVLQELLDAESQPEPLPLPPLISSQRIFRIVLSTILLLITFVAVLAGSEIARMPTPGNIPAGVEHTRNLVNSLTPNDTVLLAFDYEPGLAGEMDATSAAVVDHMMLKGAKLVLISTLPTGPVLAERFISDVQGSHEYVSGNQYVNLGFIPGGVAGLGAFARNPRWVSPDTLNGELAWETEPLKNIARISDFSLVVLITDNPNTARAWVEQVNPELDVVPFITLVSAQAEPMIRPYFDNQQTQIDGLVSGLTGGAAYEVMTRPNVARTYWDAFNIVLILAVSAILIGGFITVISTLLAQRKESEGESA